MEIATYQARYFGGVSMIKASWADIALTVSVGRRPEVVTRRMPVPARQTTKAQATTATLVRVVWGTMSLRMDTSGFGTLSWSNGRTAARTMAVQPEVVRHSVRLRRTTTAKAIMARLV
jgi:hypothetical protein